MDIEILANRLLEYALNENATEYDRQVMADAVHELSRLFMDKNQAESRAERHRRDNADLTSENKKLRADVVRFNDLLASYQNVLVPELRAELEQVKRERNAAVEQLHGICSVCINYSPTSKK